MTKNRIISSDFEAFWRPFARIFQTLCVSNYFIFRPHLRNNWRKSLPFLIYFLTLASLHILLVVLTASKGLQIDSEQHLKHKESHLMYYVNNLSIIGSIITHMTIHFEVLLSMKLEEEIYEKLNEIHVIFASKLNFLINYEARRAKYIRNTVGTFVLTIVLASVSSLATIPNLKKGIEIHFMKPVHIIAVTIIRARWCYVALLLNIIADTLDDLQNSLKLHQQKNAKELSAESCSCARESIRYFREIYSNVWFTINLLSDCFGWSLITFLVEITFEVINASYWLYINLHLYGSFNLNIRKSYFFLEILLEFENGFYNQCFSLSLDIILYNSSLLIMFWYFCMISEKCQNMVNSRIN